MNQKENKPNESQDSKPFFKKITGKLHEKIQKIINRIFQIPQPIEEEGKTDKKSLFWGISLGFLISLFVMMTAVSFFWIIPETSDDPGSKSDNIGCSINFPAYISVNDERTIELTLTNKRDEPIPEVKSFLVYPKELPIVISSEDGTSVADFGELKANETRSKKIKFYLNRSIREKEIAFDLKVMCNHKEEIKKTYKIGFTWLFPFPNLKKVSIWFFSTIGSGLVILLLTVYSEKLKRMFD